MLKSALAAATILLSAPAPADGPGRNWISRERVSRILEKRGYHVTEIEADDGHWEGEARRRGMRYDFHVDPHGGRVTKLERDRDCPPLHGRCARD